MILVKLITPTSFRRVSIEDLALEHFWPGKAISFDPPKYQLEYEWGGHSRLGFGSISFMPDLFSSFPPDHKVFLIIEYTASNEAAAEVIFEGTGHLSSMTRHAVRYDLYGMDYQHQLLADGTDYDGDTVPLPRAFGAVAHRQPVRLADVGGAPTYHKAYLAGTVGTDWHVFDDGVDICANVTDNGDGTFSLSATPTGEVTVSGTGEDGTLADIFDWACAAARLNLTLDDTYALSPSPGVSFWANTQDVLVEILSRMAAYHAHLFYIKGGTLHLIRMKSSAGTVALNKFFPAEYWHLEPIRKYECRWIERQAVEETIGKYIKETELVQSLPTIYPNGAELQLTPFEAIKSDVLDALAVIKEIYQRPAARISIPIEDGLPTPGKYYTFTDDALPAALDVGLYCRTVSYDFEKNRAEIEGDCTWRSIGITPTGLYVEIVTDVGSPRNAGDLVTAYAVPKEEYITAYEGGGPYEFLFEAYDGSWTEVQAWSQDNSYVWDTTGLSGTYLLRVSIRRLSVGGLADDTDTLNFEVL